MVKSQNGLPSNSLLSLSLSLSKGRRRKKEEEGHIPSWREKKKKKIACSEGENPAGTKDAKGKKIGEQKEGKRRERCVLSYLPQPAAAAATKRH